MAKTFGDIGNGSGFIYVLNPAGNEVLQNIPNDTDGFREVKNLAIEAAAPSGNLIANGSVLFTAVSGVLNVTAVSVSGTNLMGNPVNVTGLSKAQTAEAVAVEINSTFPPAILPVNYTATAIGDKVVLSSTSEDGSGSNGFTVTFATDDPGNIIATTADFSGGADASKVFDEAHGFQFSLDADYLASSTSCSGDGTAVQGDISNAIDITSDLITTIGSLKSQSLVIASDAVAPSRPYWESALEVDVQSGGADFLKNIDPTGFAEGDILYVRGKDSTRIVTLDETGNIKLAGGTTFATGGYEKAITLQLWAKGGAGFDVLTWFEINRGDQKVSSIADFRTNGLPFGKEGVAVIVATDGGNTDFTVGTDEEVQAITGGPITLTSDLTFTPVVAGAIAGDEFRFKYGAQITEDGFKVKILTDTPVTLTAQQALIGGWCIWCIFDGVIWAASLIPDASLVPFKLETLFIGDNSITVEKLEASVATEIEIFSVSFESDEIGDHKITMPFAGTVTEIDYAVNKLIEATDDGSIVAKDNTAGVMATTSITGGSAVGVIFGAVAPTLNNTFVAGDVLTFTTSKPTVGGRVLVSLKITRT